MNKKILIPTAAFGIVCAVVMMILRSKNPKRVLKKEIDKVGGLAHYNFAASSAKRKGLIEGDAKISSLDEINKMNSEEMKMVATVLGLIKEGTISVGPQRDEKGHFIKSETKGE